MITDPQMLLEDFALTASKTAVTGWPCEVRIETRRAPHVPPPLPRGSAAVYVFALSGAGARAAPAGVGAVLKVGRVGPNSAPRFTYQHYGFAARSTLAGSLVKYEIMWPWLGVQGLDVATVKRWMLNELDRIHFFVPGDRLEVLASLEIYVRARWGSIFEGAA